MLAAVLQRSAKMVTVKFVRWRRLLNAFLWNSIDAHIICAYGANNMQTFFDQQAPKKATNLTVNSDLLNQAKSLKINLSATLEQALIVQVKNAQREQWLQENKDAIDELNKLSDENGLFSDSFRSF
ncbi:MULTISPECIES: type II toxin-antitoxin system CcdA family antitoxin [unclassified Oleiphilus]|uniref:type II toxin-antitoxin system CcdA family antitoxin n=1 Tax=unclassified Oleiphilus TaxID=2631174 RepID=UPI001E56158B|nr:MULTISPECIES: type II toxin-antitoxin system CcdA family antitoxin [unclassified Oleiphilus]